MCHGLESILFRTSESAACPPGRVKYVPCYARSQPAKEVFVILFCCCNFSTGEGSLFARIISLTCIFIPDIQPKQYCSSCMWFDWLWIFFSLNFNSKVLSRGNLSNWKCKSCHLAGCRRGKKITQIELDSIKKKVWNLKWTLEKRKDKNEQERILEESAV